MHSRYVQMVTPGKQLQITSERMEYFVAAPISSALPMELYRVAARER
jgi:hypothetical protein